MYKLLSIDLDGTLLSKVRRVAKKEDCIAIQQFMSTGGIAYINTGRAPWAISSTVLRINNVGKNRVRYVSCLNGAYIIDYEHHKPITLTITHEEATKLMNIVSKFKSIYTAFYTPRGIADHIVESYPFNPFFKLGYPRAVVKKILDKKDLTSYKINIFSLYPSKIKSLHEELFKNGLDKILNISYTDKRMLEVSPKKASKGEAILVLAKKYKISKDEIVSMGDSFNDKPAMDQSGLFIGVAPKNKDFAKLCNKIIPTKSHAVSQAIYKYVLHDLKNKNIKESK